MSMCNHGAAVYGCDGCVERVRAELKEFPLQRQPRGGHGPGSVPWVVAERAWSNYASHYGTQQSVERMAQRGGFSWGEMDEHFPGWRDAVDEWRRLGAEVARLQARVAELERENHHLCEDWTTTWRERAEQAEAQLARLKANPPTSSESSPSYQVAQDVARLRTLIHAAAPEAIVEDLAALVRLAALAQQGQEARQHMPMVDGYTPYEKCVAATCGHPDAAQPGHAQRVAEQSRAFNEAAPGPALAIVKEEP